MRARLIPRRHSLLVREGEAPAEPHGPCASKPAGRRRRGRVSDGCNARKGVQRLPSPPAPLPRGEGDRSGTPPSDFRPPRLRNGSAGASPSRRSRSGLTVYEVFLALTLLLGALAVLSQHIALGTRAGVRGRLQTQAALYCETKLNEVLGGIEPMSPVSGMAIAEAGAGWTWSLEILTGPTEDLLNLSMTVSHADIRGQTDASFTLNRLVRDPQMLLDAASAAASAASASSTSSSASSTGGTTP